MLQELLISPFFQTRIHSGNREETSLCLHIDALCALAARAQELGLLAIEADADKLTCPIGRAAIRMMIEGRSPEFIEATCFDAIVVSDAVGGDLLSMIMSVRAAALIHDGEEAIVVRTALVALLGPKVLDEVTAEIAFRRSSAIPQLEIEEAMRYVREKKSS